MKIYESCAEEYTLLDHVKILLMLLDFKFYKHTFREFFEKCTNPVIITIQIDITPTV